MIMDFRTRVRSDVDKNMTVVLPAPDQMTPGGQARVGPNTVGVFVVSADLENGDQAHIDGATGIFVAPGEILELRHDRKEWHSILAPKLSVQSGLRRFFQAIKEMVWM